MCNANFEGNVTISKTENDIERGQTLEEIESDDDNFVDDQVQREDRQNSWRFW